MNRAIKYGEETDDPKLVEQAKEALENPEAEGEKQQAKQEVIQTVMGEINKRIDENGNYILYSKREPGKEPRVGLTIASKNGGEELAAVVGSIVKERINQQFEQMGVPDKLTLKNEIRRLKEDFVGEVNVGIDLMLYTGVIPQNQENILTDTQKQLILGIGCVDAKYNDDRTIMSTNILLTNFFSLKMPGETEEQFLQRQEEKSQIDYEQRYVIDLNKLLPYINKICKLIGEDKINSNLKKYMSEKNYFWDNKIGFMEK